MLSHESRYERLFALGQIVLPSTKRPLDQHPTIGRINKAYSDTASGLPLFKVLVGLFEVLNLVDPQLVVSCFADRHSVCLWSNHDS